MFQKLVAIEPVSLVEEAEKKLYEFAKEVVLYPDIPADDEEILRRIGDADAVLVSYTSQINRYVLERCPKVRYVGMCCSLYSEASANVDIACARERGIQVLGIRDYGDRGVVEFVLCELVRLLHGFDRPMWKELPEEITRLKVGIVGLGVSGGMIADALQYMGAEVSYYSRSRKLEREAAGMQYRPMNELLAYNDVIFTALNKNVILLGEKEFEQLGDGKILFNTSIGPSHEIGALKNWLNHGRNFFVCDSAGALGDPSGALLKHSQVICANVSAGRTRQAFELLSEKVLDNLKQALNA
ncbi:MAG: D-isomer specific 2-hydroxyacid dehydrogenase family protein [Lachnospiraceae bacterium]|nr:D-isomer specific 2-hydroxyacid dehydrogenase family protein [Lachnospiraceae bacterium]